MTRKLIVPVAFLFVGLGAGAQTLFEGRKVTVIQPETDPDGFFPKGPASVCIEAPPQRQCYTAPQGFGIDPVARVVQVTKDMSALFFSVASGGVSGRQIQFALLQPGKGKDLGDLFASDVSVSNQNQHVFWNAPAISDAQIFVTAEYVWGPDEAHYDAHRFIISAYVLKNSSMLGDTRYFLEDRFMTARKYDQENDDILAAEKTEILTRLGRLRTAK